MYSPVQKPYILAICMVFAAACTQEQIVPTSAPTPTSILTRTAEQTTAPPAETPVIITTPTSPLLPNVTPGRQPVVEAGLGATGLGPTTQTTTDAQRWFVKFDGIDGESRVDADHEAWCDILSFSRAIQKAGTVTGATRLACNIALEVIVLVKEIDKCDPKLAEATLTGRIFPQVEVHLTEPHTDVGRVTYYAYQLKNVQVVSYNISGTTEQVPVSEISLNVEEIKVTYTELGSK